jgi:hypothetical protein
MVLTFQINIVRFVGRCLCISVLPFCSKDSNASAVLKVAEFPFRIIAARNTASPVDANENRPLDSVGELLLK